MTERHEIIRELAQNYYQFLRTLPFDNNEAYMKGMTEARTKFVANLHIYLTTKDLPKGLRDRRYATDYVSEDALKVLRRGSTAGLIYEHLVPKSKFITVPCETMAKTEHLTVDFIYGVLDKFLWTATITSAENELLPTTRDMPSDWDGEDIFWRYRVAQVTLLHHDRGYLANRI